MRLNRKEKEIENKALDEFLAFAPAAVENADINQPLTLVSGERELFRVVYNFLERELRFRAEKGRHKKAKDDQIDDNIRLFKNNEKTLKDVLRDLKISRATFYRYLAASEDNSAEAEEKPVAKKNKEILIFSTLAEGYKGRISAKQLDQLKQGIKIVEGNRAAAKKRAESLKIARSKLEIKRSRRKKSRAAE